MMNPIKSVVELKKSYQKLPGIGEKTAERLAYATLRFSPDELDAFIANIKEVKDNVHRCPTCGLDIDTFFCPICDDETRDRKTLMVVSEARNVISFEKTDSFHGLYFVLGGSISPLRNVSPTDIHIDELIKKVKDERIEEVILSLSSTIEGETTALYIANQLAKTKAIISRLAFGLPLGADLEYVDEMTITRSLKGRVRLNEGEL